MPETPPKPVLFIFDLDQTLIGPTFDLYAYQSMLRFARTLCAENPRDPSCKPQARPLRLPRWHTAALRPDLVRPQLAELFAGIRRLFPTAEFALFSAGDAAHVRTFVPLIERVAGVRFLRPLFHRDHLTPSVRGTYTYFGAREVRWSLLVIAAIWVTIVAMMVLLTDPWLRWPLTPYLLWISFATVLNAQSAMKADDCRYIKKNDRI